MFERVRKGQLLVALCLSAARMIPAANVSSEAEALFELD
jgi:hypothetical protein